MAETLLEETNALEIDYHETLINQISTLTTSCFML